MVDVFFLEVPKEQPTKCLSLGFSQGENEAVSSIRYDILKLFNYFSDCKKIVFNDFKGCGIENG